jgi:CPA2 family monovalent cation:H+ antiporter-2
LFGVSLALGAFVAGAIISQSHLSHQVGADVFAFREAFSVLFFVSVGMLVNPLFLWQNLGQVGALTALVVLGKMVIVIMMGLLFPRPARTFLVVAVGLSQIGEFSFILGQAGVSLNLLDANQYSLILAAALISITFNPFMYGLIPVLERWLQKAPGFWRKMDSSNPLPEINEEELAEHVVIIGYGRVGNHMVDVLTSLSVPLLVIESDAERVAELNERSVATLYGDAANSEVITHASLAKARALVVTVPGEDAAALIVSAARQINPDLPIVVRAATEGGVKELAEFGADYIVHPELEGGLEMVHHTLLELGYPLREVHAYSEAVRHDRYNIEISSSDEHRSMHDLILATDSIEITWLTLDKNSPITGKTLQEADLRSKTGASVVALIRDRQLIANPKSNSVFNPGDRVGLIGEREHIEEARKWLAPDTESPG